MKNGIILGGVMSVAIAGIAAAAYFAFAPFGGPVVTSGTPALPAPAAVVPVPDMDIDLDASELANTSDAIWTPYNSIITNGIDEALVGTWVLESQTVVGQLNPFAGHILSIDGDGNYTLNYNSETSERAPNCSVSGIGYGNLMSELNVDLDLVDDQSDQAQVDAATYSELRVVPSGAFSPDVVCEGADVNVTSNAASVPLGVGRATIGSDGSYVDYRYTLDSDWNVLTITFDSPHAVFNYRKI